MGQITGNGRLMGQELRQLVEAGFNPLSIISKQTGLDMMELRIRMAEGKISAEDIREALTTATSEGGRFADALKRIGEETPAGQLLKMRGELEKLRDESFIPLTIVLGEYAKKTTDSVRGARQFVRTIVELRQSSNKFAKQVGKDIVLVSKVLGAFGSVNRIFSTLLGHMIEIEETAKEMEEAMIEAAEDQKEAISEVDKSIAERIALLRREREELEKGKEEFLILDYIRQGASDKYIEQLREELKLTKEAREEDEKRAEAKKKAERMAQQAQDDLKSAEQDRIKRAREIFDAVMGEASPLETLQAGLQELKGLEDILDLGTIKKAREQLFKEFQEAETDKVKEAQDATAAAKGSVEEFELLKRMDRESVAERRHKEAIDVAEDIKNAIEEGNRDRKMTAEELANVISESMPESVASPMIGNGTFGSSFSIN
jgi:tape measure domain-containing protein